MLSNQQLGLNNIYIMKNMKTISLFIFLLSALSFTSCTKEKESNLKKEVGTINMSTTSIEESSVVIKVNTDSDGLTSMYLLKLIDDIPSAGDLIAGNISGILDQKSVVSKSGTDILVEFNSKLQPGVEYSILSVLNRNDGNMSKTSKIDFKTIDISGSILLSSLSTPKLNETNVDINTRMKLVFNEEITINDAVAFVNLHEVNSGKEYTISADKLTADANLVTVDLSEVTFGYGEIILVKIPKGAFKDEYGNDSEDITWEKDDEGGYSKLDYFFYVRDEVPAEIMPSFLGPCTIQNLLNGSIGDDNPPYEWDVKLKEGTESTVLLQGLFKVHKDLEFTFDVVGGGINFSRFETDLFYSTTEQKFYVGDPDDSGSQYRLFYEPVFLQGGYCGIYDVPTGQFVISYDIIAAELGKVVTMTYQIQKNSAPTVTLNAEKSTDVGYKAAPSFYTISN